MAEIEDESDHGAIPLVEERLSVGKTRVTTGRVEVRTLTETFEEKVEAALERDSTSVTRVPIGREVEIVPRIRTEGDLTIVPVLEEILVVEKRLFLKEEIHIRRTSATDHIESHVTLRRQRAVVERQNVSGDRLSIEPTPHDEETP